MRTGIVTVVFNTDRFVGKQHELYKRHVKGDFIIVDNSTDEEQALKIKTYTTINNLRYIRTVFEERDFSRSHGLACNRAYYHLHKDYDILLFSDHDLFPIAPLNLYELMKDKVIAGVPQVKFGVIYLWAGLVVLNNQFIDRNAVDFMPSPAEQLDTGGELNKIFRHLPQDKYHLFAERGEDSHSKIYFDIDSPVVSFIHFRNGANWKGLNHDEEQRRMDGLMGLLG